jgi:ABC-type dipeptide/oligopeptide/nickel transport system permease subunit
MKKTLTVATQIAGMATLAFAGFVILAALPELGRYLRISRM